MRRQIYTLWPTDKTLRAAVGKLPGVAYFYAPKAARRRAAPEGFTPAICPDMIQRIQTVYLLLAFLLSGVTAVAPLWRKVAEGQAERIQAFQYLLQDNAALTVFIDQPEILRTTFFFAHEDLLRAIGHWTLVVSLGLAVLLTFINIFRYKNRKKQLRMGRFILFLTWLELIAAGFLAWLPSVYLSEAQHAGDYGAVFPLLTLLFLWLANRGIKRDEALVRSVDRIR